ncbi:hypothetical protein BJX76DRAFT_324592 [Aspergillus varians]
MAIGNLFTYSYSKVSDPDLEAELSEKLSQEQPTTPKATPPTGQRSSGSVVCSPVSSVRDLLVKAGMGMAVITCVLGYTIVAIVLLSCIRSLFSVYVLSGGSS